MRKYILSILLLGIFIISNGQTEKGDWLVGGRVDLNTGENSTHVGFSPNAGIFIINNFAVGGNLLIDYNKSGDVKATDFGIGPFARYYFTTSKARPLVHLAFNYLSSKYKSPAFSSTNNGSNFLGAGGVAVFINENVSIEILAGYSHTKYKDFDGSGGFNLGIGFQVYLNKRQIDNLKAK
jgi:hypothetical protein